MSFDIKQLKPRKGNRVRTNQGYINPKSCKKLFPGLENSPIEYRSDWERVYIYHLESNPEVRYWGSECINIKYKLLTDGTTHDYFPDFVVEKTNGEVYVIEIKPKIQCKRPLTENSWLWNEYTKNMSKWTAAKRFCESRGLKFQILTEETIKKL